MANQRQKIPDLPWNQFLTANSGEFISSEWGQWITIMRNRIETYNPIEIVEATLDATTLDSAGTETIKAVGTDEQYKVREIFLTGAGTNFGSGGDRTIVIQDSSGTSKYTVIPNATIESLAAGRWGDTAVPYPASSADMNTATVKGEDLVAKYTGGTTDHTTGSLTVILTLEKVR